MLKSALLILVVLVTPLGIQVPASVPAAASVEGVVVDRVTGAPISGAVVELDGIVNTRVESFTATTGRDGRFTISNIPPSDYWLIASVPGIPHKLKYVPYVWGQRGLTGPGTQLSLVASQKTQDMRLELVPTSRISGRVLDASGKPQGKMSVKLLRPVYAKGSGAFAGLGGNWGDDPLFEAARSDEHGEFRFDGVAPGQYYLSVTDPNQSSSKIWDDLVAASKIYTSYADVKYETTYFPGVTDPFKAVSIDVRAGTTVEGLEIPIRKFTFRTVHGRVIDDATGIVIKNASVLMVPVDASDAKLSNFQIAKGGTFDFNYVTPRTYFLFAYAEDRNPSLFGRTRIEVGQSIDNLTIRMKPGVGWTGRVVMEGNPSRGIDREQVSVVLRPTLPSHPGTIPGYIVPQFNDAGIGRGLLVPGNAPPTPVALSIPIAKATIEGDGTFHFKNVMPWDYTIEVETLLPNSFVKSARVANIDVLNDVLHLDSPLQGDLEILISNSAGSISGKVLAGTSPVGDAFRVVLVPGDPTRQDLYRTSWTDNSGQYRMERIAPGEYMVYCWDFVREDAWRAENFLRLYSGKGTPVHISGSSAQTLDVRVIPEWY